MSDELFKLNKRQKDVLAALLDKYESSKTYRAENSINQSFKVKPSDFFRDYDSDFANLDEQEDFEREMQKLESTGFVKLEYKNMIISYIVMNVSARDKFYSQLGRKELRQQEEDQIAMYKAFSEKNKVLRSFCLTQIKRIEERKKAEYPMHIARDLIRILVFIDDNSEEILERELSIELFGDSKVFEKEFRSKILTVLKKYGDFKDLIENVPDEREQGHALFAEFNVFPNPTYVNFKGAGELVLKNGKNIELTFDMPIAVDADTLDQIDEVKVKSKRIVTIENLTSFNRVSNDDSFYIYLAGYHNTAKQRFLQKIAVSNCDKEWFHFGDIDPDGFFIFEHLKAKTGIAFKQLCMSIDELEKYREYCKPLESNDIRKAKSLEERGLYVEEMKYMLKNNIKLEQEVISWKQRI